MTRPEKSPCWCCQIIVWRGTRELCRAFHPTEVGAADNDGDSELLCSVPDNLKKRMWTDLMQAEPKVTPVEGTQSQEAGTQLYSLGGRGWRRMCGGGIDQVHCMEIPSRLFR